MVGFFPALSLPQHEHIARVPFSICDRVDRCRWGFQEGPTTTGHARPSIAMLTLMIMRAVSQRDTVAPITVDLHPSMMLHRVRDPFSRACLFSTMTNIVVFNQSRGSMHTLIVPILSHHQGVTSKLPIPTRSPPCPECSSSIKTFHIQGSLVSSRR